MYSVILTVTLTLEGPILSKSTSMGRHGLDAVMAKNYKDEYYLPGTLIKGRLRHSIEELSKVDLSFKDFNDNWLGKKSGNSDDKAPVPPMRTRLNFTDFVYKKNDSDKTLHRIKIDKDRGSVEKGSLLIIEAPFDVGERVEFKGKITFTTENESEIDHVKKRVEIGLKWIPAFGSEKSLGFGRLLKVQIDEPRKKLINTLSQNIGTGNEFIDIIIKPDSPFCFARRQVTKNLFESEDIIPGSAIKGALISTWSGMLGKSDGIKVDKNFDPSRKELSEHFDKIRITHAFPIHNTQNKRPVVAPLSLVKVKKKGEDEEKIYDVAFQKSAVLIEGYEHAPAFAIDWKDSSDAKKIFGWDKKPNRELRIRTAIDRDRRKAEDKKLFAYEMVSPKDFKWASRIDLSRITDNSIKEKVDSQLRELLSLGLVSMSKTKTSAKIVCSDSKPESKIGSKCEPIGKSKYWVITLQTPAILCNPANLNEISTDKDLSSEYAAVWNQISGETLKLSHFFAAQSLAGGYYLYKRFQDGKNYYPYLLTDAGSVFVLTLVENQNIYAKTKIEQWSKYGLEFPKWAKEQYGKNNRPDGDNWTNCPYIPENGFGEIAINLHESYQKEIEVYEHRT